MRKRASATSQRQIKEKQMQRAVHERVSLLLACFALPSLLGVAAVDRNKHLRTEASLLFEQQNGFITPVSRHYGYGYGGGGSSNGGDGSGSGVGGGGQYRRQYNNNGKYNPGKADDDNFAGYNQGNTSPSTGYVMERFAQATLYVALETKAQSRGWFVSDFVTKFLNDTVENWDYFIRPPQQLPQAVRPSSTGDSSGPDSRALLQLAFTNQSLENMTLTMQYFDLRSSIINETEKFWWWKYNLLYNCYFQNGSALTSQELLDSISHDMQDYLTVALESDQLEKWFLSEYGLPMERLGIYYFATEPQMVNQAIHAADHATTAPANGEFGNQSNYSTLDANAWDWKRYLGLGMLLGTFFSSGLVMLLASYRQRRLREQQIWGNLATPEGLDEMLKLGWKLDGTKMEVYDKSKQGYVDGDSMLIGGYEQKIATDDVAAMTTENRTPTQPESTSSPGRCSKE